MANPSPRKDATRTSSRPRWQALLLPLALLPGLAAADPAAPLAPNLTPPELEDSRTREIHLLRTIIDESRLATERRIDAARTLLERSWPEADQAVAELLTQTTDPTTRLAIATAIARIHGPPPPAMAPLLFEVLLEEEGEAVEALGLALGRYEQPALLERITTLALDPEAAPSSRRAAITALAHRREQQAAATLIELLEDAHPRAIQAAARHALTELTGIRHFNGRHELWRHWWQTHRDLDPETWLKNLLRNFARQSRELKSRQKQLEAQVVESRRRLYRMTPEEERPASLVSMLEHEMPAIRALAIQLAEQRLLDNKPIGPSIRQGLRTRLTDRVTAIRRSAALLLRDLADPEAADRVAEQVTRGSETHPEVLRAFLRLLARMPRAQALETVAEMLADPQFQEEAAGALAAAAETGLAPGAMMEELAMQVRQWISENGHPLPAFVTLLGQARAEEDAARFRQWLDAEDPAVRTAAAKAWALGELPLLPLVERLGDTAIQSTALSAAERRGRDAEIFRRLANQPPEDEQGRSAWRQALVAMAGRTSPGAVLAGETELAEAGIDPEFRERLITAAIDAPPDEQDETILDRLLLRRAEIRLSRDQSAEALADLQATGEGADRRRRLAALAQAALETELDRSAVEALAALLTRAEAPLETARALRSILERHLEAVGESGNGAAERRRVARLAEQVAGLLTGEGVAEARTYLERAAGELEPEAAEPEAASPGAQNATGENGATASEAAPDERTPEE